MNTKRITGDVSDVLPDNKIVINRGQKDGVELGQKYQIYRVGEMLTDLKTGESLGKLESTCGYGTVEQIQPEESTLTLETFPEEIDTSCHVRRVAYEFPPLTFNWICPECGAENGKKDIRHGKFICWKCGYISADRPSKLEFFTPDEMEPDALPHSDKSKAEDAVPPPPETLGAYPVPLVYKWRAKRSVYMVWLALLVAALVLLGVIFMKPTLVAEVLQDNSVTNTTPENEK